MITDQVRELIIAEWVKAKHIWSEDECTRNLPGHVDARTFIKEHYGQESEWLLKVEGGDHWYEYHRTKDDKHQFIILYACDGTGIREVINAE